MPRKTNDTLSYTTSTGITQEARGVIVMAINPVTGTDATTYTDSSGNQREAEPVVIMGGSLGSRKPQIVATRGAIPGGVANSGTTYTRGEHRMKIFFGPEECTDVQMLFGNFMAPGNGPEVAGPNMVTGEAAWETITPSVAFVTAMVNAAPTWPIYPNAIIKTDKVGLSFSASAQVFVRTGVIVTAGQSWVRHSFWASAAFGDYQYESTSGVSQVQATGPMSQPAGGQTAGGGFMPIAIIGTPKKPFPAVALWGDSIMAGTVGGDTTSTINGARGAFARACFLDDGTVFPYSMLCRHSEQASFKVGALCHLRKTILPYCSHILDNDGTNDIVAGRSVAQIKADKLENWKDFRRQGLEIHIVPIAPRTSGGNVTPATGFEVGGKRDQLNAWYQECLADGTIDGICDINQVVEGSPGLWAANITTDWTHFNAVGTLTVAAFVRNYIKDWFV